MVLLESLYYVVFYDGLSARILQGEACPALLRMTEAECARHCCHMSPDMC